MPTLHVDLKVGETVRVSGPATFTLEEKSGQRARLNIQADANVRIERVGLNSGAEQAKLGIRRPM